MNTDYDVLIIGGGGTGAGTALDLALRGLKVALLEQGGLAGGTTGKYHGLLHSGGRYAVDDRESARECMAENTVLRRIVPHAIADTGGLFITTRHDDPAYMDTWLAACRDCGIPAEELAVAEVLGRERKLDREILRAAWVPDAVCDSVIVVDSLGAAILAHGGKIFTHHAVAGLTVENGAVTGLNAQDTTTGETVRFGARMVVNAAGPWAGKVAALAGCRVSVQADKGSMVAMEGRLCNAVLNRCRPSSDGDILVPTTETSVMGTTSVMVDDPDRISAEQWEIDKLLEQGEQLIPGFRRLAIRRAWAAVRPLFEEEPGPDEEGREIARTFVVLDHETRDGVAGLVTVVGGKFTTYRLMAEKTADAVCTHLGIRMPSTTRQHTLEKYALASASRA